MRLPALMDWENTISLSLTSSPLFFLSLPYYSYLVVIGFKIDDFFKLSKEKARIMIICIKNVIYLCKLIKNIYFCTSLKHQYLL